MTLRGERVYLRAIEPEDVGRMYVWENDSATWASDTTHEPLSRNSLERFVEEQRFDVFQTRQLRLMIITTADDEAVGCIDLFEIDPLHARAGVGILIYGAGNRRRGYALEAVGLTADYAREALRMHQLWCEIECGNGASRGLFLKAGFAITGTKRDWIWSAEGCRDVDFLQKIL